MTNVIPPGYLKIPVELHSPDDVFQYFKAKDFLLLQLWQRTGGSQDLIAQASNPGPLQVARLTAIEQRLGSGDALTSDETGFTVDTTALSVDMDES